MSEIFSTSVEGLELRMWLGEPEESWLRRYGRTRVLLIDDQWPSRRRFLDISEDAPLSPAEQILQDWLNVDLQFFPMPDDYAWTGTYPEGTFSDAWFETTLLRLMNDPRPIAAILLDLLYGDRETLANASGRKFLTIIRRHLPEVPVLILSSVTESHEVLEKLKGGSGGREPEALSSFQDYVPKTDPQNPNQMLLERISHRLLLWADLSDPAINAFSFRMRRLARQMRQIVFRDERIEYEVPGGETLARPILFIGDYGCGKNFLAHRLVQISKRSSNPFHTISFADATDDGIVPSLFGSLMYTGATECIYIDPADGTVLDRIPAHHAARHKGPVGSMAFAALGALQRVDIADQALVKGRSRPQPLQGSLLLDELGASSARMQTLLLGVLNSGRFTPHLGSRQIPVVRAIDVWFLVTATPELHQRLREDLRGRLARGYRIRIPALVDRGEDVVPLALSRVAHPRPQRPDEIFTDQAREWLVASSERLQVRDLVAMMLHLRDVSAKRPYGMAELQQAFELSQTIEATRFIVSRQKPAERDEATGQEETKLNILELLAQWRQSDSDYFPSDIGAKNLLQGKGLDVDGGTAALRLAYLDRAISFTEGVNGKISVTRAYQYQYGKTESANVARDRLASVFESDKNQTMKMLRRSDRLLCLAIDISKRRKKIQKYIDLLAREPGQQERITRLCRLQR